ncbi:MAG: hypothetical protein C4B59_07955 [Candidatus Methanogaster sp.]|uniref:Uncharacterized protein n=1 Tax=Candidatus Methanogaster sp. TaxID=3386292 RepID=A0AC61L2W8_9EURY|nr:MAG: hypothetical protein C4B59_07955 [ANME-2 cluster archaeon]
MIWFKQAEKDLKASKNSLKLGDYEWVCFQAQQAAGKSLKSILFDDALSACRKITYRNQPLPRTPESLDNIE